jgi:hypothetical protein
MPLNEDRDAIIEVLQFTGKLFDLLISRFDEPDLSLFQNAWNETRPVLDQHISLLLVPLRLRTIPFGLRYKESG